MVLALALTLGLGAAPDSSVAVLIGRRTAVSSEDARGLAQALSKELAAAQVALTLDADAAAARLARLGLKDSSFCGGKKVCLLELGKQLAVEHLVVLSASQVGSDRSVALELWRVADGAVLEREGLLVPPGAPLTAELVGPFAARLKVRFPVAAPLPPPPPPPVKAPDAPVAPTPPEPVVLAPAPVATPVVVVPVTPPPPPSSHTASLVLGGAGAVALAAGAVLLANGLAARAEATRTELVDGTLRSPLTASAALAKADTANLDLSLATVAGAAGLGLGAAAFLTW